MERARAAVVIVGGGFAGASTACFLARAGVGDVVLLERESVCGAHASGRNAALCRQLAEDDEVTALTVRGARFLHDPPAGFAASPLLAAVGSLLLCSRAETVVDLDARAHRHGLPHQVVSLDEARARWPLLGDVAATGGVFFPTDGVVDIHALLLGYLAAARRGGARVECDCAVTRARACEGGFEIETPRGTIAARCLVNAAGAWADELAGAAGAAPIGVTPLRRHLFQTARLPQADRAAPWAWQVDDELYLRSESGGLLMCACDEEPYPPGSPPVSPSAAARLAAKLARVAPRLGELPISRAWACLRTFAPGRRPVVAWDQHLAGFLWVAGLGGNGVTASAAVGELAASEIASYLGG